MIDPNNSVGFCVVGDQTRVITDSLIASGAKATASNATTPQHAVVQTASNLNGVENKVFLFCLDEDAFLEAAKRTAKAGSLTYLVSDKSGIVENIDSLVIASPATTTTEFLREVERETGSQFDISIENSVALGIGGSAYPSPKEDKNTIPIKEYRCHQPPPTLSQPKVISVTSFKGGTGKTMVSVICAAMLMEHCARVGKNVLLVDGDIGQPGLSNLLHFSTGFVELPDILQDIDAEKQTYRGAVERSVQCIAESGTSRLNGVFGSKTSNREVIAKVSPETYRNFIEAAREQYEYIIVDSPPIEAFSGTAEKIIFPIPDYFLWVLEPKREIVDSNIRYALGLSEIIKENELPKIPRDRIFMCLNKDNEIAGFHIQEVKDILAANMLSSNDINETINIIEEPINYSEKISTHTFQGVSGLPNKDEYVNMAVRKILEEILQEEIFSLEDEASSSKSRKPSSSRGSSRGAGGISSWFTKNGKR